NGCFDMQNSVALESKIDCGRGDGQRMTQRDQFAGSFRGLDAGEAGDLEHVALGQALVAGKLQPRWLHAHLGPRAGFAQRFRLLAGIDHPAGPLVIKMRKLTHYFFFGNRPLIWAGSKSGMASGAPNCGIASANSSRLSCWSWMEASTVLPRCSVAN